MGLRKYVYLEYNAKWYANPSLHEENGTQITAKIIHRTIKSAVTRRGCIRFRRFFHRLKAESQGFSVLPVAFVEEIAIRRYGP